MQYRHITSGKTLKTHDELRSFLRDPSSDSSVAEIKDVDNHVCGRLFRISTRVGQFATTGTKQWR